MTGLLVGKVAFVTGGSRGIGRSILDRLAEEGANLAFVDLDEKSLRDTTTALRDKGIKVFSKVADVSDENEIKLAVDEAYQTFGSLDILVNNAGVLRDNLLFKMTANDWETVMDVHLKGTFFSCKAAQHYMVNNGYGRIINISSTSALGNRGQANYSAAKAGLQGFTKTLAIELGKYGITVNSVAPGLIETEMTHATAERMGLTFEEFLKGNLTHIPVGRAGKPEDIAHCVTFLADERSSYINGQVIYVAGGPTN